MAGVQATWRFCGKCNALFYNGAEGKGVCTAGEGHSAIGYEFFLPYDQAPLPASSQDAWRFCGDCYALYFDGYPEKGHCPGNARGHRAYGFDYAIPHDLGG